MSFKNARILLANPPLTERRQRAKRRHCEDSSGDVSLPGDPRVCLPTLRWASALPPF